jgi:hypothetical protein
MIRKSVFGCFLLFLFLGIWWYNDRPFFLYPALPFGTVEKHVVVAQLKQADHQLVTLGIDDNPQYLWIGAKTADGQPDEMLKAQMLDSGWSFIEQMGAGYFYQKGSEKIVITSQRWSRDFELFKVPSHAHSVFYKQD